MNESFLMALSAPQPIPGGGSAAAYGASVGLALLEKIIRLELGRLSALPEKTSFWEDLLGQVNHLKRAMNHLRDEDGRAYIQWVETRDAGLEEEKIDAALKEIIMCPMRIMKTGLESLDCASVVAQHCKKHLLVDLLVASEMLEAGIRGAHHIAHSNWHLVRHTSWGEDWRKELEKLYNKCRESFLKVQEGLLVRQRAR